MKERRLRTLVASALVLVLGAAAYIGFILFAAQLDTAPAATRITQAFETGALSDESTRSLALITGFVVADSDQYSTCVPLSLALSAPGDVFGNGPWEAGTITCGSLRAALQGAEGTQPWYRYWNGGSAILKVLLTFVPYSAVQVLMTLALIGLLGVSAWQSWRYSRTFAVGTVVILGAGSDLLWQGMSPGVGVSSVIGLLGAVAVQQAFIRKWAGRWGVVMLAGLAYASTAQMHIPIAFAMMAGLMAMVPLLGRRGAIGWRPYLIGPVATVLWVSGYVLGLLTRYAWIAANRGGVSSVTGEVGTNSPYFLSESLQQAFLALVTLLMRTWFAYGWLEVGLWFAFMVLGWALAKGGARGWRSPEVLVALSPILAGALWLLVWGRHTQHLFVNVLIAMIVLNVLFGIEAARRRTLDEPGVPLQPELVEEQAAHGAQGVESVSHASAPVD